MIFGPNKKKETAVQDTFYNLCKDLIRYIDKKIIKKYISPNQAQVPKEKRIKEKIYNDNKWRYFYEDDETTEEDRIRDIFKNNKFLFNLQKLYDALGVVVNDFENNKKNLEILEEQMRKEKEKLKLNSEINTQIVKYLIDNKIKDINSINQNDLLKAFTNLKNNNIIKNINQDMIQQFMSNTNNIKILQNNINKQNNSNNNNLMNNNTNLNIYNNNLVKENNIKLNSKNKILKNKSIPTLIQALEAINKSKNNKMNNKMGINNQKDSSNKIIHKNNILDSDSNDNDDSENNEEDEEEEDKKEENNKMNNIYEKNKYKVNENRNKKFLNKKIKRRNDNNNEIIDINDYI